MKHEDFFEFEVRNELTDEEHDLFYKMYLNVSDRNQAVNPFTFPKSVFKNMNQNEGWEFVVLKLKESENYNVESAYQAIGCCYKNGENYTPFLLGLDYSLSQDIKPYKQFLYRIEYVLYLVK